MTGACVVLLKDWMMHERGLHARDYAWRARARSNMPVVSMKSIRTRVCLVRSHCEIVCRAIAKVLIFRAVARFAPVRNTSCKLESLNWGCSPVRTVWCGSLMEGVEMKRLLVSFICLVLLLATLVPNLSAQ